MLHQTHLPLSLSISPFTSFTTSSSPPSLHPSLAETKMECVNAEAALKNSFSKTTHVKLTSQTLLDDSSDFHVQNIAPVDDFSVDDFLNFSNEEEQEQDILEEKQLQNHSPQHNTQTQNEISHPIINNHFESLPTAELTVPVEEPANEWLSYFVEDSFSQFSMTENHQLQLQPKPPEPKPTLSATSCFKTPVPAKARSKRTRTGVRVWPVSFVDSSSTSSSTALSSSSSHLEECSKPPEKKAKRVGSLDGEGRGVLRRCSHCGVQKTPQWRTGPAGPKTLCNACGVRYKSGRLLPEYRPACSPTFSTEMHSNHHRKVLEMRRKKEVVPGSPLHPAAPGS